MNAAWWRWRGPAAALGSWLLFGCSQQAVEVTLRSLQASSEVTFVCRDLDGSGRERKACPDFEQASLMFALVTQTATNEIAVINTVNGKVIDEDMSVPGNSFLRVPSRPGDIVTSPGGEASFVGLTSPGKTGIAGLPTVCLGAPVSFDHVNEDGTTEKVSEAGRDITTFPACSLPGRPGDMVVLVVPPGADGVNRASCDPGAPAEDPNSPGAARERWECPANLTSEEGPAGRRKLWVSLPDFGQIAVIDAQGVLDHEPGTFEPCAVEAWLDLGVELGPDLPAQDVPDDLDAPGCTIERPPTPPAAPSYSPRPGGFASSEGRLFVADLGAPVIHVLDTTSPCAPVELPPLLPVSFDNPERVVFTSRVAASPITPSGRRYVYAVDLFDEPAASVMAFDVSSDSTNRTPIVRPGSVRNPLEPPDRIRFGSPATDVAFALRDLPAADPETGVAEFGVRCDPDPASPASSPGAQYRPADDGQRGARPRLLRGLFGLVLLTSGQVVVIDVDDFDEPCRRPITTNASSNQDFRGCSNDGELPEFLTLDGTDSGTPTVSTEVSCHMVEPHRVRSASIGVANSSQGVGAPALRSLPQFVTPNAATQSQPADRPKLLAVDFAPADPGGKAEPPLVYVGTTLYTEDSSTSKLDTNPNDAEISTLTLPWNDPRSYPSGDNLSLTFEGRITREFSGGFLNVASATEAEFSDASAYFCNQGVYDLDMMRDFGEHELGLAADSDALETFATRHADYVQVTDAFPDVLDAYWTSARAQACSPAVCLDAFGSEQARDLDPARELTITRAFQDHLEVVPRNATLGDGERRVELFGCCFPEGMKYVVRAAQQWVLRSATFGFRHDVTALAAADAAGNVAHQCIRDCDPRRRFSRARVFEMASEVECASEGMDPACRVGLAGPGDEACTYDPTKDDGVQLEGAGSRCIFENLTSRFAVYRGLSPSLRDMSFTWQTSGGFLPLIASLTSQSNAVLPRHIEYLPELQSMAVVDAASLGLSLMSLDTLAVQSPWPVF